VYEAVDGVMFQLSRSNTGNRMAAEVAADRAAPTAVTSTRLDDTSAELRALGLPANASWEDVCAAHARLVADLTPGPDASHGNVALARRLLDEVNGAFDALRARSSVA